MWSAGEPRIVAAAIACFDFLGDKQATASEEVRGSGRTMTTSQDSSAGAELDEMRRDNTTLADG